MESDELKHLLDKLRTLPEAECIEFKEAKTSFDFDKLGKYFSAISNEANLKNKNCGWLVFGISDGDKRIIGTSYRLQRKDLDGLKSEIANHTNNRIAFTEIHELDLSEGRVLIFQIPAASKGIPSAWKGHYYGREGESINALSLQKLERIRNQAKGDWSAQICKNATVNDFDPKAVLKAREQYRQKNPQLFGEVNKWDDLAFLNKAKLMISGKVTNAAIVLLGKEESGHFLSPSVAQITWVLEDEHKNKKDYTHFGPPFILNVEQVFTKIRNLKYRYLPAETLFPTEISKYDPWVIREALHNCIAHQDYELNGKINVIEKPDELVFTNVGSFIPGNVETVIKQDLPPEVYRNSFLAHAMVNLNMIDTIGSGIRKMFETQRKRFFPLPDYNLASPEKVVVRIQGQVLNENYTRLLIKNKDMDLSTVMLLDKVQKGTYLSKNEHKVLKSKKLVEGRYPNIYMSSHIAAATEEKAKYIKNRGFNKKYYQDLIIEFIKENGAASRKDINDLVLEKLPAVLTIKQKGAKVNNLIYEMSKLGIMKNFGTKRTPRWKVVPKQRNFITKIF